MMKHLFLFLFLSVFAQGFAQISGTVMDSATNKAIPYVNIWVEGKDIGTSSDEQGNFVINETTRNITLIFSAVGYETKNVNSPISQTIYLIPKTIELPELIVSNQQGPKSQVIDSFKKRQIKSGFTANDTPWIVAKFFPYNEKYDETRFLKSIRFLSESKISGAIMNVRLYHVGKDGKPDNYITSENILVTVPKGRKIITVNLEEYHIRFPENGLFIGFERLIIGKNRYTSEYTIVGDKTKKKYFSNNYAPHLGAKIVDTNDKSWIYSRGNWTKLPLFPGYFNEKHIELALELTLTN